jgi:predicted dehydrogenase
VPVVARRAASVERARAGGADPVHEDLADLGPLDGVVVAVPTERHAEVVTALLDRGVPVFVEKPLTNDPTAARAIVDRAGDRVFVMDKWRYHPGVRRLADLARTGALGTVAGLQTRRVQWGNPHDDVDSVWTLAPHDLSIALEVLGGVPTPRAAVAHRDGAQVTGLFGVLHDPGRPWLHVEVSSRAPLAERRIEVHGDAATAVLGDGWDTEISIVPVGGAAPVAERVPTPGELPLLAELRAFVGHLGGGPPPRSSAREGLVVVEALATLRQMAGVG